MRGAISLTTRWRTTVQPRAALSSRLLLARFVPGVPPRRHLEKTLSAESVIQEIEDVLDQSIINVRLVHRQVAVKGLQVVGRPGDTIAGFGSSGVSQLAPPIAIVLTRLTEIRQH